MFVGCMLHPKTQEIQMKTFLVTIYKPKSNIVLKTESKAGMSASRVREFYLTKGYLPGNVYILEM